MVSAEDGLERKKWEKVGYGFLKANGCPAQ